MRLHFPALFALSTVAIFACASSGVDVEDEDDGGGGGKTSSSGGSSSSSSGSSSSSSGSSSSSSSGGSSSSSSSGGASSSSSGGSSSGFSGPSAPTCSGLISGMLTGMDLLGGGATGIAYAVNSCNVCPAGDSGANCCYVHQNQPFCVDIDALMGMGGGTSGFPFP